MNKQFRYIRMRDLASTPERKGRLPVHANTLWRWVKKGTFPTPIHLSPGCVVWDMGAIEAWENARKEAV